MTEPTPRPRKRSGPSLEAGVARLSGSTEGLTAVLDRLTATQVRLADTESRIDRVQAETVRQEDLEARDRLERRFRRLFWAALGGGLAVVGLVLALLSSAAHGTCERRQETTRATIALANAYLPQPPQAVKAVKRLEATLDKTCDEQYPLHF